MKIRMARALLLATAAIVSCGKGGGSTTGSTGDAGVEGPTNLVVAWTLAGSPASATTCRTQGAVQVFVNLTATLDPSLHQSVTVDCATGTTTFAGLLVQDLGSTPYLEGTLLDAQGVTVPMGIVGVDVTPVLGTTSVTLAFFGPQNTGGGGAGTTSSTTTTSSHAASSSSGGGGGGSTSSSASTSTSSSTSTTTSSSTSTTTSSSGSADAGDGG